MDPGHRAYTSLHSTLPRRWPQPAHPCDGYFRCDTNAVFNNGQLPFAFVYETGSFCLDRLGTNGRKTHQHLWFPQERRLVPSAPPSSEGRKQQQGAHPLLAGGALWAARGLWLALLLPIALCYCRCRRSPLAATDRLRFRPVRLSWCGEARGRRNGSRFEFGLFLLWKTLGCQDRLRRVIEKRCGL